MMIGGAKMPGFDYGPYMRQPAAPAAPAAPRRGMFGGNGRAIAGLLGDAISRLSGGEAMYVPMMLQQRQQEQAAAQRRQEREQERADNWTDWQARQDYERAHPATPQPTEFERVLTASGLQPGTPEYMALARQYAESRANPMQYLPNGDGTFTVVPRGGTPPQGQPQGRPAIGTRVDRLPTGGPTSPASGNFRP